MAADIKRRLREAYVRNFPDLEHEYRRLYPPELCAQTAGLEDLYDESGAWQRIHGDLSDVVDVEKDELKRFSGTNRPIVPEHDVLCAGFPCQPFSKSGAQLGFKDLNGTVFRMLAIIIAKRKPRYVFLENVGNFERHDKGNTWKVVRDWLEGEGYSVKATTTVGGEDGGLGLLSPHHLGLPQHRERFFIVAQHVESVSRFEPERYPFPLSYRSHATPDEERERLEASSEVALRGILNGTSQSVSRDEFEDACVSDDRTRCVDHWQALLKKIDEHDRACRPDERIRPLPSFPIWGFELDPWNHYPADENPGPLVQRPKKLMAHRRRMLLRLESRWGAEFGPGGDRSYLGDRRQSKQAIAAWVASWPGYARDRDSWPRWKVRFIEKNREWAEILWERLDRRWLRDWLDTLATFPASHQKLEWNCQGESADLWRHILQFRPSGLRVKRFRHIPALVAMTTTQIPILPASDPDGNVVARHLMQPEALQLQGFPVDWHTPPTKGGTFAALGNAVHVDLVAAIVRAWLFEAGGRYDAMGELLPTTDNAEALVDAPSSGDERVEQPALPLAPADRELRLGGGVV